MGNTGWAHGLRITASQPVRDQWQQEEAASGAAGVEELAECLSSMQEVWVPSPAPVCNHSLQKVEAGRSEVQGHSLLLRKAKVSLN